MIDKKSIEAYRNIKAPAGLRDRVLAFDTAKDREQKRPRYLRMATGLAACLILAAGISIPMLWNHQGQGLTMDGQQIKSAPVQVAFQEPDIALARIQQKLVIELELTEDGEVQVSKGSLQMLTKEDELLREGERLSVKGHVKLDWLLEETDQAELTITTTKAVMTYEMYRDETSKQYYMKLKETEKL